MAEFRAEDGEAASERPDPGSPQPVIDFEPPSITARGLASRIFLAVGLVIVAAQGLTGHTVLAIATGSVLVAFTAFTRYQPTGRGRLTDQALVLLDYDPPLQIPWEWIVAVDDQPDLDHLPHWQRAIASEPLRLELLDGQVVTIDLTDRNVIREIRMRSWAF